VASIQLGKGTSYRSQYDTGRGGKSLGKIDWALGNLKQFHPQSYLWGEREDPVMDGKQTQEEK